MYDLEKRISDIEKVIAEGPYTDSWDSLTNYEPPQWYRDAKFGIFIHWGIYSVPAFGSEWYSRCMYIKDSREYKHHIETYGPHKEFGYKDFLPMFKAENFDAGEWIKLFKEAGAQYVTPVAEHHDGFQMYDSELSEWCSSKKGPMKDILGELSDSCKKEGLVNCASTHRVEHWFFMGHGKEFDSDIHEPLQRGDFYWPAMTEPNHQDLFSEPTPSDEYLKDWLCRCCEIVDKYQPKLVYFDWWIQHSAVKPYLKKFAAYYYNRAHQWGEGVVINYKHDAFQFGSAVVDIERGQFADAKPYIWQTDTTVGNKSWGYIKDNEYKSSVQLIQNLVDIVSKNGRMMLNVGPKADGTIPDEDQKILREIGSWLKVNGEAIYGTKLWRKSGEGPTIIEEGQFGDNAPKNFTSKDIRFTVKGENIYAICMNMKDQDSVTIESLAEADAAIKPNFHGIVKSVECISVNTPVEWTRDEAGLTIRTSKITDERPIVFKITVD